jgi:hypothetical protein
MIESLKNINTNCLQGNLLVKSAMKIGIWASRMSMPEFWTRNAWAVYPFFIFWGGAVILWQCQNLRIYSVEWLVDNELEVLSQYFPGETDEYH